MLWLASFPRSGNTFFRIVLQEVYGIDTVEASQFSQPVLPSEYRKYPVVKTHLLPDQLVPSDPAIPAVYLVRDGRDAIVSLAHYRSNIVSPGSSYRENLRAAIRARRGSFFGGWSEHVRLWRQRAKLVIRFEDLIQDPLGSVEHIRPWVDLPPPRVDKLPTFGDLKAQSFRFEHSPAALRPEEVCKHFFRRGQVGSWKGEIPRTLLWLFYYHHGKVLRELGYETRSWMSLGFAGN